MTVGQRVKFVGFPSYLQGRKGTVIKKSSVYEDMFTVEFDDGNLTVTEEQHVEVLDE